MHGNYNAQNIMKFPQFDSKGIQLTGKKLASTDELVASLAKVVDFMKLDTAGIKNFISKK